MSIQRILIVDDDPLSREFLIEAVSSLGYQPQGVSSASEALECVRKIQPDLVLTDLRMPDMDGVQLIEALQQEFPGLPTVIVTAHGSVEAAVEALRLGAEDFLLKPVSPDTIELVFRRIGHTQRLELENEYLRSELVGREAPMFIAKSPLTLELLRSSGRIANSNGTVLITGESGTGKERVAQYIHQNSPRAGGPFIRVNCAALSENLLESELFGHERGAFTGAHRTRPGRFELADGGSLLLDELGEISPALQAKLLRVLEEEEFERVGGNSTLRVDVRVIATTNRDLPEEIAKGSFREDLYYRLHVLPIHMPPLRDRTEDIMPLAEHFLALYAQRNGLATPKLDASAQQQLMSWRWPGNVRELENVIQRAVILLQGDTVKCSDLSFGPKSFTATTTTPEGELDGDFDEEQELGDRLANLQMADIERMAILATLACTGGNKTEAARRLGLTARTLSNKLKIWKSAGLVA
jgi:DNA-binding NtrC family response regulator